MVYLLIFIGSVGKQMLFLLLSLFLSVIKILASSIPKKVKYHYH